MLNKIGLMFFVLVISSTVFAQEKIVLSEKQTNSSTELWNFSVPNYTYSGNLEVQIQKKGNGGTLLVQVQVSNPDFYIGGTVYLFLEDGKVITCTDKKIRSVSEKLIQSNYILTPTEINLLKKTKLTDVRFKINGNQTQFSSPTGYFTAHNAIKSFGLPIKSYDTVEQINQIFKP